MIDEFTRQLQSRCWFFVVFISDCSVQVCDKVFFDSFKIIFQKLC